MRSNPNFANVKDICLLSTFILFLSNYHVGFFKRGKFHGTEAKEAFFATSTEAQSDVAIFAKHHTKCQMLSVLSADFNSDSVPTVNQMKRGAAIFGSELT